MNTNTLPATILAAKEKFELACKDASALQIVSNFGAAFPGTLKRNAAY